MGWGRGGGLGYGQFDSGYSRVWEEGRMLTGGEGFGYDICLPSDSKGVLSTDSLLLH